MFISSQFNLWPTLAMHNLANPTKMMTITITISGYFKSVSDMITSLYYIDIDDLIGRS